MAKKKKPKKLPAPVPAALQFFLRSDADCAAPFLSLTDAEDGDCIYDDDVDNDEDGAADGVPLTLDTMPKVTTLDSAPAGATVGGRGVEHDEPVSSIQVPALQ